MTLEATYGLKRVRGILLQQDVQYIINPRGDAAITNALAVGMNVVITPPEGEL